VPVGLIVGRWLWQVFARQLGVLPDPAQPWLPLAATVAVGVVLALAAAVIPARMAARASASARLRAE